MALLCWHRAPKALFERSKVVPKKESRWRKIRFWSTSPLVGVALFGASVLLIWMLLLSDLKPHSGQWLRRISEDVDVVGVALKPTCVTRQAVVSLNRYFQPRSIIIITPSEEFCSVFRNFANNVKCEDEDRILPGVSKDTVGDYLQKRYNVDGDGQFKGRTLAGWYLQQFLKMGAAQYLPDLSKHFLIWDLDMILLQPLYPFYRSAFACKMHRTNLQTVVNTGGARNPGYDFAYERLTGNHLEYAQDGSSFVTHWLVVYKPYMDEFLSAVSNRSITTRLANRESIFLVTKSRIGQKPPQQPSPSWVWSILDSLDPRYIDIGFSEYASYVSWVKQHYPESQHIMRKCTWRRNPLGGLGVVSLGRFFHPDGLCCPFPLVLGLMRVLGYQYVGFEIGHNDICHYSDEQYKTGYGV